MTLVSLTSSILNDENRIVPISAYNGGIYDIVKDLYIGLPAVLNATGVHHVVRLNLNKEEQAQLESSATMLRSLLDQMVF